MNDFYDNDPNHEDYEDIYNRISLASKVQDWDDFNDLVESESEEDEHF